MEVRIVLLLCICTLVLGGSPDEWRSRTIYQLLTDRFALSSKYAKEEAAAGCSNLQNYCGGTFKGIQEHLDYIAGMGFDAIWISPIPQNTPGGYHGYWQQDIYNINSYFGTSSDLKELVNAAHQKGIWVMVDVVANHVGPGYDYSSIVPWNKAEHYHDCTPCPSGCSINDWNNQAQAQENSYVAQTLTSWVKDIVANYSLDGIRIDTVPEVPKDFWVNYVKAAGVYSVGEVFNGDIDYVGSYQQPHGPLPGVLSYPLFFTLRSVFAGKNSMWQLQNVNEQYQESMGDVGLLGTFIDNHDNARFLNQQSDIQLYKNALVYTLLSEGIPIIYYGTEQGFNGGNDPNNREPLWISNYNQSSPLYQFISKVVAYRKKAQVWKYPQVQRYADNNFYAFTRGTTFVAMTNGGSSQDHVLITITYHPYSDGQKLCNLFYPTTDCFVVQNKEFQVYLKNGECKIYYPV